jgi:hypothetical protein
MAATPGARPGKGTVSRSAAPAATATTVAAVLLIQPFSLLAVSWPFFPGRIFDIAPLLQPLFEGLILLAAVSDINLK